MAKNKQWVVSQTITAGSIQEKKESIPLLQTAFFFKHKKMKLTSPLDGNIQVPMYGEYSIFINVNMSSLLYCTESLVHVC